MQHHDDVTYKTNFRNLELDTLSDVKTKNIEWFFLFLTSRDKQTVYLRDTVGSVATDSPRDIGERITQKHNFIIIIYLWYRQTISTISNEA